MILRAGDVPTEITTDTEWLLASTGNYRDTVGWEMLGDDGWVNAPIRRVNGQLHLVGQYGYVDLAFAAKGVPLDQLKELAKTLLPKN